MFSSICVWINGWINNRKAGDLRPHRAHYDVIVINTTFRTVALNVILCWNWPCHETWDSFSIYCYISVVTHVTTSLSYWLRSCWATDKKRALNVCDIRVILFAIGNIIGSPIFVDTNTGIHPHAAPQYHAWPNARRGIAVLNVNTFSIKHEVANLSDGQIFDFE